MPVPRMIPISKLTAAVKVGCVGGFSVLRLHLHLTVFFLFSALQK